MDYGRQDVLQCRVAPDEKFSLDQLKGFTGSAGSSPIPGVTMSRPAVHQEEPLRAELKHFLEAVRSRSKPLVSLEEGRRALKVALEILDAIAEHHKRAGIATAVR